MGFLKRNWEKISTDTVLPTVFWATPYQKPTNSQPSLQDYIQSFGSWKSQSDTAISALCISALCINVSGEGEIETYNNVTSVRAYQIDPFTPFYGLEIEMEKPGYTLYNKDILTTCAS